MDILTLRPDGCNGCTASLFCLISFNPCCRKEAEQGSKDSEARDSIDGAAEACQNRRKEEEGCKGKV